MAQVRVEGLDDLLAGLRAGNKEIRAEARKLMRTAAANPARDRARQRARSMGGIQARAALSIAAVANPDGAAVRVKPTTARPFANVAYWGARARTGWYASPRYASSATRQHPPWIGNMWQVARRGQGPYAINDAVADVLPQAERDVADGVIAIYRRAFPEAR